MWPVHVSSWLTYPDILKSCIDHVVWRKAAVKGSINRPEVTDQYVTVDGRLADAAAQGLVC